MPAPNSLLPNPHKYLKESLDHFSLGLQWEKYHKSIVLRKLAAACEIARAQTPNP